MIRTIRFHGPMKSLVMKEGKMVQQGTPQQIYYHPVNEYVAGMFGKYNLLTPVQAAWFGIEANGKEVMIRPESFVINKNDGVKGTIQKISFWGGFYEVQVLVKDLKIVVRSPGNVWKDGDAVFVSGNQIAATGQ